MERSRVSWRCLATVVRYLKGMSTCPIDVGGCRKLTNTVGHSITSITKIQTSTWLSRSFLYMAIMMIHQGYVEINGLGDELSSQLLGWPFCSPRFTPSSRLDQLLRTGTRSGQYSDQARTSTKGEHETCPIWHEQCKR